MDEYLLPPMPEGVTGTDRVSKRRGQIFPSVRCGYGGKAGSATDSMVWLAAVPAPG